MLNPRCQKWGCDGCMRMLDPAIVTLEDQEIWFHCQRCGTHTHSANVDPHEGVDRR